MKAGVFLSPVPLSQAIRKDIKSRVLLEMFVKRPLHPQVISGSKKGKTVKTLAVPMRLCNAVLLIRVLDAAPLEM